MISRAITLDGMSMTVEPALVDRLVLIADAAIRYRMAIYRNRYGLTEVQYRILAHAIREAPVSVSRLSQLINRDCGQTSRTVKSLVEAGLLYSKRRKDSAARAIALTPEGLATYAELADVTTTWDDAVKARLSGRQLAVASAAIDSMYQAALELLEKEIPPI